MIYTFTVPQYKKDSNGQTIETRKVLKRFSDLWKAIEWINKRPVIANGTRLIDSKGRSYRFINCDVI